MRAERAMRNPMPLPLRPVIALLLALAPAAVSAQAEATDLPPDYLNRPVLREILPDGEALLAELRARLPPEPRRLSARLTTRSGAGGESVLRAETELRFGAQPAAARYLLTDSLGGALEQLEVLWMPGGDARYRFARGPDLTPAPDFRPDQPVHGLDFTWSDLSLSFLWWTGAVTRASESLKLRKCYVVEVPAPPGLHDQGATMRLWIDAKEKLMMRAESLDAARQPLRRIEVDSIKKIDGLWMVKDLDFENPRTGARTRVRVDRVE
jgi:hypothetical protein